MKVDLPKYCKTFHPSMMEQRPQLMEAAAVISDWWRNGRTGDVLNVSMPTRFGKSFISTAFTCWALLGDMDLRVLRASYAADLAEMFALQVRDQIGKVCERMEVQPPAMEGTRSRWSLNGRTQPSHAAIGITGGITGFGFDVAIIDDTAKNMLEATSAAYSRTLASFKESVLLGRLEGRRKILNVGTRWTTNDWFSMWPDAQSYTLPAMKDGRSVCEAWKTTAELELERSRVSEEVWTAQYMQQPTATGKVRIFEGWRPVFADCPQGRHVLVCDPATDYGSDFFVIGEWVEAGGILYLCDMFASQRATPEEAARWVKGRDFSVMWVEANGVGSHIIDLMRRQGVGNVAGFTTSSDKYSRAYVRMNDVKDYLRICHSVPASVLEELARQLDGFPVADHDDLADNVVMAFERMIRH